MKSLVLASVLVGVAAIPLAWAQEEPETSLTLGSEPQSVSEGADVSAAPPLLKSASGVEYRNGGVGKEERDALHLVSARSPLKIVFSAAAGAFVSDASVTITDKSGKTVFEAAELGPMVFVNVPAGSYTVAATSRGTTKKQSVSLGAKKQTAISFGW